MASDRWSDHSRQYRLRKEYLNEDREKGRECTLRSEEIRRIIERPCYYCREEGKLRGLVRKDRGKGFEAGNVVACCLRCNRATSSKRELWERIITIGRIKKGIWLERVRRVRLG